MTRAKEHPAVKTEKTGTERKRSQVHQQHRGGSGAGYTYRAAFLNNACNVRVDTGWTASLYQACNYSALPVCTDSRSIRIPGCLSLRQIHFKCLIALINEFTTWLFLYLFKQDSWALEWTRHLVLLAVKAGVHTHRLLCQLEFRPLAFPRAFRNLYAHTHTHTFPILSSTLSQDDINDQSLAHRSQYFCVLHFHLSGVYLEEKCFQ